MNMPIRQLENGATPADPETVLDFLAEQGLTSTTCDHPPMFTVLDSHALRPPTCDEHQSVDLRHLGTGLGAGRLSFASPERLMRFLGITTGAVSPLALINDVTHKVHFAIDQSLLRHEQLHVHPLVNTLTTTLKTAGLLEFAITTGHSPVYLKFNQDKSVTVDESNNKMLDEKLKVT